MNCAQILEASLAGERLSIEQALVLDREASTAELARVADALRRQKTDPNKVTYLVDRNVNYTNVCITDCKFCEFYRRPGDAEAYVINKESLEQKIQETLDLGGTRILLQGGHNPDLRIDYYLEMLQWIKNKFPEIRLSAFSPSEIDHVATLENMSIEAVLKAFVAAGLDGLPGGGGEILDDEIRMRVSPKKQMTAGWIEVMRVAHRLDLVTSASQVIGFGEETRHRLNALEEIRKLQDESQAAGLRGFLSFVMWPLQYESRFGEIFGNKKGVQLGANKEQYLRHTALGRLFLDNFEHIAVSWPTMGADIAMEGLAYGADDFGSTMIEENVVSSAGSSYSSMTEDLMREYIAKAGYQPTKRDIHYQHLGVTEGS